MPVYRPGRWLNGADRPDWCDIAGAGRFAVPVTGGRFERHYHDGPELWFISGGKARIYVDGGPRFVRAGDIVLTAPGDVHDVVEVYETLTGFFTQTSGVFGHRYADPGDAGGHDVPALPVPADFGG